jgi:uncharacterized protein YecE (DUF72 family)
MNFHLGLAIWGYKGWLGDLFPAKTKSSECLSLYGQRFTCVEGNTTFYAIPTIATVERWAAQVPPGFEFCPKLPKSVTHNGTQGGRLTPYLKEGLAFFELMQHWGDRLGALFLQLPPTYSPQQFDDLSQFLQGWTAATDFPLAVEVRHIDWFSKANATRLNALLEDLGLGRVLLDTRPIYPPPIGDAPRSQKSLIPNGEKKPNVPVEPVITSDFTMIRYISHPDWAANEIYLQAWTDQIQTWLTQGKKVYFFVHCPIEEHSPTNARHLQAMLEAQGAPVPPLPWNQLPEPTAQLRLFS